jgi:hypothetical protein
MGPSSELEQHLSTIQTVIARLAGNSFLLKGWSVTIVAALAAVAVGQNAPELALAAIVPALLFWLLDAYYLRQERLYRDLYDHVRHGRCSPDCTLVEYAPFCMSTACCREHGGSFAAAAFSASVALLHGALLAALIVITIVIW